MGCSQAPKVLSESQPSLPQENPADVSDILDKNLDSSEKQDFFSLLSRVSCREGKNLFYFFLNQPIRFFEKTHVFFLKSGLNVSI